MKRFIVPCLLVLGGLVASCTETDDPAPRSILEGTFDLTRVDKLVFVTSTDRDELRVLELADEVEDRDFLRAPNLLRPLSIPVLDRPQALARDVSFDKDTPDSEEDITGREVLGPYVYARSNGSEKISIVDARQQANSLRELATLSAAGPVTAFAGRGPTNDDTHSVLYFSTQEATGGRLWRVVLVGPDTLNDETPLNIIELKGAGGESLVPAGEAVSSLLVLSQAQGADRIVFSTRGAAGLTGQTFLLEVQAAAATATATATPLAFGGPVLQLATHGELNVAQDVTDDPVYELPAGKYIFGTLDPAACSAQPQCTGVLAVDSTTRQVALDVTNTPMLPIRGLGAGLPMGLTIAPSVELQVQEGTRQGGATRSIQNIPLLGIVPLSDGDILFFSVLKFIPADPTDSSKRKVVVDLRTFDTDTDEADNPTLWTGRVAYTPAGGGAKTTEVVKISGGTAGVTRNEVYELVYQGVLPGLADVAHTPSEPFQVGEQVATSAQVMVGDLIVLRPAEGTACATPLVVSAVGAPSNGQVTLVTSTPIPEACADYPRFQVRAGGDVTQGKPLVAYGPEGFLGRLGKGETLERQGPYFFHPNAFTGDADGQGLAVAIKVDDLEQPAKMDDSYLVTTLARYEPLATTIDTVLPGFGAYRVPGAVVQADVGNIDFAYIAYPSANGILQVNLETITHDVPTSVGLLPFE